MTETWTKWTRVHSSLETMVSRSHHWLHQFQLVTEHSLKGATNYGNRATGVGTKHAVLRPRPRHGSSGLERDLGHQVSRPRPRHGQNELECTRVSRPWSRDQNIGNKIYKWPWAVLGCITREIDKLDYTYSETNPNPIVSALRGLPNIAQFVKCCAINKLINWSAAQRASG